ncbi:MAG: GGDEF domain-containing protein [bacterium]
MSGQQKRSPSSATIDGVPGARVHPGGLVGATLTVLTGLEAGRFFVLGRDGGVLGRDEDVDVTFSDETVSRSHATLRREGDRFTLTDLDSHNGTLLDGQPVKGSVGLPRHCRLQLGTRLILEFTALDELGAEAVGKLSQALLLDPLTGTGNRLHLERRLAEELSFAQRHRQPLGLLLLDLDHFKAVNDRYGHLVGDRVLSRVGRALTASCRTEDAVFRYGGEEFCILVRGLAADKLMQMAERILRMVAGLEVNLDQDVLRITTSIGVAPLDLNAPPEADSILLLADKALYRAKAGGRNRAVLHDPAAAG